MPARMEAVSIVPLMPAKPGRRYHSKLPRPAADTYCQRERAYRIIPCTMARQTAARQDLTVALREEFRSHLETFYSRLKLAPPYESVEQAIRSLTTAVHSLPEAQR